MKIISRKTVQTLLSIICIIFMFSHAQSLFNGRKNYTPLEQSIGLNPNQLLEPQEAFKPSLFVSPNNPREITLYWEINPDYYLYKDKIELKVLNQDVEISEKIFDKGLEHSDEFFGTQEIYDKPISIELILNDEALNIRNFHLMIEAQGCAKSGFCFAPFEWEKSIEINSDITTIDKLKSSAIEAEVLDTDLLLTEHDRLTQNAIKHPFYSILTFFGLGLLLTFTPCVLPMLPILSGILTRQGSVHSARKGFTISLVYVLAMAFVYTLLGLFAAFLGKGLTAYLQHPYILIGFSLIFVLLALSMFDFYQLQMPSFIQTKLNKLSNQQQAKNNYIGIAIMGALSALIVGPCITAPLIGAIGFVAQTQNYFLGAAIFFSLSIGMGTPLLILGASSGHLLPKVGIWMNQIKVLFGFMLLGLAAYFLGRILNHLWEYTLYSLIALTAFIWLIIYIANHRIGQLFFGTIALATLFLGIYSITLATRPITTNYFTEIKGINGLNQSLQNNQNSITILEFKADWCVACKEMEKYVFSHDDVKNSLSSFNLITTDVTKNDTQDKALQKYFGIFGPPAILFFDSKGNELKSFRIMGSVSKESFLKHIDRIRNQ